MGVEKGGEQGHGVGWGGFEKSRQNFCLEEIKLASSRTKSWRLEKGWDWFPRSRWHRGPHSYLLVGSVRKWDGSDSDLGSVVRALPPRIRQPVGTCSFNCKTKNCEGSVMPSWKGV